MSWLRQRKDPRNSINDPRYCAAKDRLEDLERRVNKVAPELIARRNRNHWGETIASIARRERS